MPGLLRPERTDLMGKPSRVTAEDVPAIGDDSRTVPQQTIAAGAVPVVSLARHSENIPPLLQSVINGDQRSGASITTVPRHSPLMIRLRTGKWVRSWGVPGGYSERITPRTPISS